MNGLFGFHLRTLKTKYLYSFAFLFEFHFPVIKKQSFPNLKKSRMKKVTIHRRFYQKNALNIRKWNYLFYKKKCACSRFQFVK